MFRVLVSPINRALAWLRIFYERRIAIPLDSGGLMLDVGCGEKPHWRADVLVDNFVDEGHTGQRNTRGAVEAVAPLFKASIEELPFRDKAFDYVYCSHVLEHVTNPAKSLAELMRVGKSGYIEVPYVGIQKLFDQATHLWMCRYEENTLLFIAKERVDYDPDITHFLRLVKPIAFTTNFYPDAAMIRLHWSPNHPIAVKVSGTPNTALIAPDASPHEAPSPTNLWPRLRSAIRFVLAYKLRRVPVTFNSIMKDELRVGVDTNLRLGIYRIATHSPKVQTPGC